VASESLGLDYHFILSIHNFPAIRSVAQLALKTLSPPIPPSPLLLAGETNSDAKTKGFKRGMLGGRVLAVSPFGLCYYF
jgi:hypothetical protein